MRLATFTKNVPGRLRSMWMDSCFTSRSCWMMSLEKRSLWNQTASTRSTVNRSAPPRCPRLSAGFATTSKNSAIPGDPVATFALRMVCRVGPANAENGGPAFASGVWHTKHSIPVRSRVCAGPPCVSRICPTLRCCYDKCFKCTVFLILL